MKIQKINVGNHTYLSESKNFKTLPKNCLFDKGKVGCGGTTIAIESKDSYVICVPFVSLIDNKLAQYPNKEYNGELYGFYAGTTKSALMEYLEVTTIPKIFVTYDSLEKLVGWIDTSKYKLLVDELHILFTEYSYRSKAALKVLNNYSKFNEFCFMTATPLEPEFILDELMNLPIVEAVWDNVTTVEVQSVKCIGKVVSTVIQLVNDFKNGKYPENAYFFVNSVKYIKNLVDICELDESNTRVIYSKNNKTEVGIERGNTIDEPKKINFITSTAFEGQDIYDENGLTFIISDSAEAHTLIDISTKFQQIAGRIRNSKYANRIYHVFKETRYSELNYDDFMKYTLQVIEQTKELIKAISGKPFADKIDVNELYVQKNGNEFTFDANMVKIDLYHFKISRNIYSLRANLLAEYQKYGFKAESFNHIAQDIIVTDRSGTSFEVIVEEVAKEAEQVFNLYYPIREMAFNKYPFLEEAISTLGFDGIRDSRYVITNIKSKLIGATDSTIENKIFKDIKNRLPIKNGDFIAGNKIKSAFNQIYVGLGLKKKAKATDIMNYYEVLNDKELSRRIDGKPTKGYVILRAKILVEVDNWTGNYSI